MFSKGGAKKAPHCWITILRIINDNPTNGSKGVEGGKMLFPRDVLAVTVNRLNIEYRLNWN